MRLFGMCIKWKVVAGLAVVGVGIWALAPQLLTAAVPLLIVAVCPLSMLLILRGMGSMNGMGTVIEDERAEVAASMAASSGRAGEAREMGEMDETIDGLRQELARVHARQEELLHRVADLRERDASSGALVPVREPAHTGATTA